MSSRIFLAALLVAFALSPVVAPVADAATRTPSGSWYLSAYSREGDSRGYTRYRYSSAIQKAINKLDDDAVEDLPMPVLFVKRSAVYADFGDPRDGGARTHEGQDILAPLNSFVVSPTDAVVTRVGKQSSEGNFVNVAAPGGETFIFMHLDHFAAGLSAGDVLKPGDLIGYVGNTGNAAGGPTHLHFEIRENRTPTDPYPRLTGSFTTEELIASLTSIVADLKKQLDD